MLHYKFMVESFMHLANYIDEGDTHVLYVVGDAAYNRHTDMQMDTTRILVVDITNAFDKLSEAVKEWARTCNLDTKWLYNLCIEDCKDNKLPVNASCIREVYNGSKGGTLEVIYETPMELICDYTTGDLLDYEHFWRALYLSLYQNISADKVILNALKTFGKNVPEFFVSTLSVIRAYKEFRGDKSVLLTAKHLYNTLDEVAPNELYYAILNLIQFNE